MSHTVNLVSWYLSVTFTCTKCIQCRSRFKTDLFEFIFASLSYVFRRELTKMSTLLLL